MVTVFLECDLLISIQQYQQEGWVKGPEVEHILWSIPREAWLKAYSESITPPHGVKVRYSGDPMVSKPYGEDRCIQPFTQQSMSLREEQVSILGTSCRVLTG